jgi:hypothetical protein
LIAALARKSPHVAGLLVKVGVHFSLLREILNAEPKDLSQEAVRAVTALSAMVAADGTDGPLVTHLAALLSPKFPDQFTRKEDAFLKFFFGTHKAKLTGGFDLMWGDDARERVDEYVGAMIVGIEETNKEEWEGDEFLWDRESALGVHPHPSPSKGAAHPDPPQTPTPVEEEEAADPEAAPEDPPTEEAVESGGDEPGETAAEDVDAAAPEAAE